jgi:hypothetical protein
MRTLIRFLRRIFTTDPAIQFIREWDAEIQRERNQQAGE